MIKKVFIIVASLAIFLGCAAHESCMSKMSLAEKEVPCECAECDEAGECSQACGTECSHKTHEH